MPKVIITIIIITRAIRECKLRQGQDVILDLNSDSWINPDVDVCRIPSKMLWIHYLVGVSHFTEYCKNRPMTVGEMLTNILKSHVPQWCEK